MMIEELPFIGLHARLRHQRVDPGQARLDFVVAHQWRQPAFLLEGHVDAGFLQQAGGQFSGHRRVEFSVQRL